MAASGKEDGRRSSGGATAKDNGLEFGHYVGVPYAWGAQAQPEPQP